MHPEFNMHTSLIICFVCALFCIKLSGQNPVRPNTYSTKQCKTWNETLHKCQECNVGFVGIHCNVSCRYPSYGKNCQSRCNCLENYCDPAIGCKDGLPTISLPAWTSSMKKNSFEFFTTKKNPGCPAGFTGAKCNISCRYPSFGYLCQFECNCSRALCNFAKGCDDFLEVHNVTKCEKPCQYPAVGCQSKCNCSEEYCKNVMGCNVSSLYNASDELLRNKAMLYITIILGVWSAFQCFIYFCLSCGFVSCCFV